MVLVAGLGKLCPQASLVVTSVGRSSAESLLTCTQRHRGSVALHERLLGPLGCVLGALGGSWTLLEASWKVAPGGLDLCIYESIDLMTCCPSPY